MTRSSPAGFLAAAVGLAAAIGLAASIATSPLPSPASPRAPAPVVRPAVRPAPCPPSGPCPRPSRPWGPRELAVASPALAGQAADPEPMVDLLAVPGQHRPHNTGGMGPGGPGTGSGLCVWTSIQYAAWIQNVPELRDLQKRMTREPGGGCPGKVDAYLKKWAPNVRYVQYEGSSPAIIELALKTGRLASITWGQRREHMLTAVHLDATRAAIVDNNDPNRVQWFSRSEFLRRWAGAAGAGWVVVLLNPGPPPPPRNQAAQAFAGPAMPPASDDEDDTLTIEEAVPVLEGGVTEWASPSEPTFTICGRRVTGPEVRRALVGDELADDSTLLHLTVIGAKADRDRVLAGLGTDAGRYLAQGYDADAWELDAGFARDGLQVYLQDRAGRVLLRREGEGDDLAGALRRADPSYRPELDPSGQSRLAAWPAWLTPERGLLGVLIGGGAAGAGWLALRTREQPVGAPARPAPAPSAPAAPTLAEQLDQAGKRIVERALADALARLGGEPAK